MSATAREIEINHAIGYQLSGRRDPHEGDLPRVGWPEGHPLGYDIWNGMTLCVDCADYAEKRGDLWNPENDYFLQGVRSITSLCYCGNCGEVIRPLLVVPTEESPLCCWCDDPSEGLVDSDSPACGKHLAQYGVQNESTIIRGTFTCVDCCSEHGNPFSSYCADCEAQEDDQ